MGKWTESLAKPDLVLTMVTLTLVTFGTVMIYSSSSIMALDRFKDGQFFLKKQVLFFALGFIGMVGMSKVPYSFWEKWSYLALALSALLCLLVLVPSLGVKVGGARRWLRLGPLSLQVAELAKVAIIIYVAHYLTKNPQENGNFFHGVVKPFLVIAPIIVLILIQPDLGTSVVIIALVMAMLFLGGIRMRYLLSTIALAIPLVIGLIMAKGYRQDRLRVFIDPWRDPQNSGFQIIQSLLSFGSGGTFGVGVGDGMQKLFYLPEPHTDFILAVIAEESGFVGVFTVLVLFVLLLYRGFMIAFKAPDRFGALLASGLTILIGLEGIINIAGVMGLAPLKGLALPFLSYGGSSLVVSMMAVGILLNISASEA